MSKIVYLLGAGASFGLRDKDNSTIGVHDVYEDSEIIGTYVKYELKIVPVLTKQQT